MTIQEIEEKIQHVNDFEYISTCLLQSRVETITSKLKTNEKEELIRKCVELYSAYNYLYVLNKELLKEITNYNKVFDRDGIDAEVAKLWKEKKELKERLSKVIEEKEKLDDEVSFLRERNEILERKVNKNGKNI